MDDAQFQAWLDQHGGEVGRKDNEKTVDGPPDPNTGVASKQTVIDSTTITAKDGATITLRRNPGPHVGTATPYTRIEETPPKPATGTTRTPEQQTVDAAAASKATEDERERAYHRGLGHGNLTHAEYEAKLDKDQAQANADLAQARADRNVERQAAAQEAANQLARERFQHEKDKANLPDVKSETVTANGQRFTRVTRTTPQGQVTVSNFGPDGKPVDVIPTEGQSALPPGMPTLDTSSPERARETYLAQVKWAQEQMAAGKIPRKDVVELLNPSFQAAESVIKAGQTRIENERATRGQDITQEGNRLQAAGTFASNAQRAVDDVWKVAPRGGTQAADVLMGQVLLQQLLSRNPTGAASTAPVSLSTPEVALPAAVQNAATAAGVPNALGLGAVPGAITPNPPAAPPVDAATKAAGIMANPVFRPGTPVPAAVQNAATAAGVSAPAMAAPAVSPASEVGRPGDPYSLPVVNPATGEPTGLPQTPPPPINMDPSLGPVGTLPASVRMAQSRSILDQILAGAA